MKFKSTFLCLALLVATTGCATSYGKAGLLGGMKSDWIDENSLEVKATGNGFRGKSETQEMFLLWASEKGAERGFKYFVLKDFSGKEWLRGGKNGYNERTKIEAVADMYIEAPDVDEDVDVFEISRIIETLGSKYKEESS